MPASAASRKEPQKGKRTKARKVIEMALGPAGANDTTETGMHLELHSLSVKAGALTSTKKPAENDAVNYATLIV